MSKKTTLLVLLPIILLLTLSPMIFSSGISDFSKGATVGIFLGLTLLGLVKGIKKAR